MDGNIFERLVMLETRSETLWEQHDQRSKESLNSITGQIDEVKSTVERVWTKLDEMPCQTHEQKIKNMENEYLEIKWLRRLIVATMIGVFAGAILKMIVLRRFG